MHRRWSRTERRDGVEEFKDDFMNIKRDFERRSRIDWRLLYTFLAER